ENIVEANSKLALTQSVAEVAGPPITGILVKWISAPLAILVDALSFACSAISLALIRKPEPRRQPPPGRTHVLREISDGLRFALRDPVLRALLANVVTGAFFVGFYSSLYILFAVRELRLSTPMLGAVIAVGGAANVCGALI